MTTDEYLDVIINVWPDTARGRWRWSRRRRLRRYLAREWRDSVFYPSPFTEYVRMIADTAESGDPFGAGVRAWRLHQQGASGVSPA